MQLFAGQCAKSGRFSLWFPRKGGRTSKRAGEQYLEAFARCERLEKAPLFYVRGRLNGKEGQIYGKRNQDRREGTYHGEVYLCMILWIVVLGGSDFRIFESLSSLC